MNIILTLKKKKNFRKRNQNNFKKKKKLNQVYLENFNFEAKSVDKLNESLNVYLNLIEKELQESKEKNDILENSQKF